MSVENKHGNRFSVLGEYAIPYFAVFILSLLLQVTIIHDLLENYYPTQDTLSYIVNSTNYMTHPNFSSWFTEGLTNYFIFSPEWSQGWCNYIRPVANFTFYCLYLVCGDHWSGYLFFCCIVNSLGILLVFIISHNVLRLSRTMALLASLVMFLNSFRLYLFYCPAYIFDALAAVFLGIAFLLIIKKRYIMTAIVLAVAAFTKEFALFGPFAAALTYLLIRYQEEERLTKKDMVPVLTLLLPVFLWFFVRRIFAGGLSGNYGYAYAKIPTSFSMASIIPFMVKNIRALFHWPIGWPVLAMRYGAGYVPADFLSGKLFRHFDYKHILAIFNLILNGWFFMDAIQCCRKYRTGIFSHSVVTILPWILGIYSLLLVTLNFLGLRYGYSYFMLVIPFAVFMITQSQTLSRKILYTSYVTALCFMGVLSTAQNLFDSKAQVQFYRNAKNVTEIIHNAYIQDPTRPIYLVNDVSGIWGSYYLGRFAARSQTVDFTVLNSVWILEDFLEEKPQGESYVHFERSNDQYTCSLKLPDNRILFFYGSNSGKMLDNAEKTPQGLVSNRSGKLKYILNLDKNGKGKAGPFGNTMTVTISDKNPLFIYYSFEESRYKVFDEKSLISQKVIE